MSAKQISRKKELQQLCVFGYLRKYCIHHELPLELIQICVLMYVELTDEWDAQQFNRGLIINTETQTVRIKKNLDFRADSSWFNAFGTEIIKKGQLNVWQFLVSRSSDIDADTKVAMFIGIIAEHKVSSDMRSFFVNKTNAGYGLYTWHGSRDAAGVSEQYSSSPCRSDDIITMILDMTQKNCENATLSYKINDVDQGVAFDNIPIDGQYVMAVTLCDDDEQIQILKPCK